MADEMKPLAELDALRLEKLDISIRALVAEISARQIEIQRLQESAQRYVADLARGAGTENWTLDLPGRRWIAPSPLTPTPKEPADGRPNDG